MSVRINTNVDALDAQRHLSMVGQDFSSAVAKLSSGLRINTAADDAAGLAISEKLTSQINGFDQGGRNAQDAISMIQTGEGALNTTHSMLQRMRELAVQASNSTYTDTDRSNIQAEINQLVQEIDRIAQQTDFNTKKLLDGSAGGAQVVGGGPDIKQIQAQAGVAINGSFGIVGNGTGVVAYTGAAGGVTTFQAYKGAAAGVADANPGLALNGGGGAVSVAAGNGTTYTFTVDSTNTVLTVSATGGRANGFATSFTDATGLTTADFRNTVNNLPGGPLKLGYTGGGATNGTLVFQDTEGGVVGTGNPGGPQVLALSNVSGVFTVASGTNFANLASGSSATAVTGTSTGNVGAGAFTGTAAVVAIDTSAGNQLGNAVPYTQNATRSAVESSNIISGGTGSFFTQQSSITITGGLGTQTFTAQAGEALSTFFQQVNGSGIGVTMAVDQNNGKLVVYNNNYGTKGTDVNGNTNATGATAVSVTSNTGDFAITGLNLNFTTAATTPGNYGNVDANLTFTGGAKAGALNAVVTVVDPTATATGGYRSISATGINSDQISGLGGMSGVVITLANPGNIKADSFSITNNAALNFQVGANANQTVALNIDAANSQVLGVTSLDVLTTTDAEAAITQLDRAIQAVSSTRANMGAVINRLQNSINNDATAGENASASNSQIRDVDVARETVDFTRDQILLQAGTAVLAQANQAPTAILSLLR